MSWICQQTVFVIKKKEKRKKKKIWLKWKVMNFCLQKNILKEQTRLKYSYLVDYYSWYLQLKGTIEGIKVFKPLLKNSLLIKELWLKLIKCLMNFCT